MVTCPSCGSANPADMRFCGKCGSALEVTTAPSREVAGRADEAGEALDQALALYEQKGDIVTRVRIRASLGAAKGS